MVAFIDYVTSGWLRWSRDWLAFEWWLKYGGSFRYKPELSSWGGGVVWKAAEDRLHPSQHIMGHVAGGFCRSGVKWCELPPLLCFLEVVVTSDPWGVKAAHPWVTPRSSALQSGNVCFFPFVNYRGCSHNSSTVGVRGATEGRLWALVFCRKGKFQHHSV